jgi:hypothetical protein
MATKENKKLSPAMQECVEAVKRYNLLVRWKGGYWTREKCPVKFLFGEIPVPEWYFTGNTIMALVKRGVLQVTEENFDTFNQTYYPVAVKLK